MNTTILFVDDENSVRKAVQMILKDKYQVITSGLGAEALKLFHQEKPELTLLDIGLPDMNGIDVLRALKDKAPDTIVIMLTAVDEVKTIVEAVKRGAYDYLVKPIDAQELRLTIENALENKCLKDQLRAIQQPRIEGIAQK
ncbi:response regulator [Desulfonema magnum]|uniref:Two component system response regulator n=1 Tax=Desulfonema magnum TaxID=45655 RepID=A0A975BQD4_9BACT|nr:response regulator [Desulfonema magnum]QTA89552.1 Two component system response regulator [Desulfonema magnum]